MNNKLLILLIAAGACFAQTPDAFTGTWTLNATKSRSGDPKNSHRAGTRTYQAVAGGTHVTYDMTHTDGTTVKGEYTTQCKGKKCTAEEVTWTQKNARTVEGFTYQNGKPDARYVRSVSADGKTMTILFYPPTGKKTTALITSVQVWEKQ
jgi:hypothetical protein